MLNVPSVAARDQRVVQRHVHSHRRDQEAVERASKLVSAHGHGVWKCKGTGDDRAGLSSSVPF
jgi:hypothetical protein